MTQSRVSADVCICVISETPPTERGVELTSDLQKILDQLHCLDLKTHCLLHRWI